MAHESAALTYLRRRPHKGQAPTAAGALVMTGRQASTSVAVNRPLTRKRRRRERENPDYLEFARRVIRAAARRAGEDIEALPDLVTLGRELDAAIAAAVTRLRAAEGHSWAEVAARLGTTRQAAQQRYGGRHAD